MSHLIYHQCNKFVHLIDGMTVMLLSPNLLQKIRAATDNLCQITLRRKLLHKFEKWCEFARYIKVKSRKKNHVKRDLPV